MLEIDLADIANTLPGDEIPRWFPVPSTADQDEARAWAVLMLKGLEADFRAHEPRVHESMLVTLERAASEPSIEPFEQKLLFLPFGLSLGVVVHIALGPTEPDVKPLRLWREIIDADAGDVESFEESVPNGSTVVGIRRFKGYPQPYEESAHGPWTESRLIVQFAYAVCVQTARGPMDLLAVATSTDSELAALAYFTFGEMLAEGSLFQDM